MSIRDKNKTSYIRDGRAPIPEKEFTSKVMSSIKSKNTKPEILLRKVLWEKGIRGYRLHWNKVPGTPDITFPGKKIAIFVNGCYWHRCPHCNPSMPKTHIDFWQTKFKNNILRDEIKSCMLTNLGWTVLIIWECQIHQDIDACVTKIKALFL